MKDIVEIQSNKPTIECPHCGKPIVIKPIRP